MGTAPEDCAEHPLGLRPVEEHLLPGQADHLVPHRDQVQIPLSILVISGRIIMEFTAVALDDEAASHQEVHATVLPGEPHLCTNPDPAGLEPPAHRGLGAGLGVVPNPCEGATKPCRKSVHQCSGRRETHPTPVHGGLQEDGGIHRRQTAGGMLENEWQIGYRIIVGPDPWGRVMEDEAFLRLRLVNLPALPRPERRDRRPLELFPALHSSRTVDVHADAEWHPQPVHQSAVQARGPDPYRQQGDQVRRCRRRHVPRLHAGDRARPHPSAEVTPSPPLPSELVAMTDAWDLHVPNTITDRAAVGNRGSQMWTDAIWGGAVEDWTTSK